MRRLVISILLSVFALLSSWNLAFAALINIDSKGEVVVNVLSSEDQIALSIPERNELSVKQIAANTSDSQSSIALTKEGEKVFLTVGEEELDVTNWEDELVEIEERGDVKSIEISIKEGNFIINQDGISAKTSYPINVEPKENKLSVETSSGETFLGVFPVEAAETALRSKYITRLPDKEIGISEKDIGILAYEVDGEREIEMLKIIDYAVPVTVYVSASTGEIVSVDQPTWLRIFGILLI
jgi:hypothetical protein